MKTTRFSKLLIGKLLSQPGNIYARYTGSNRPISSWNFAELFFFKLRRNFHGFREILFRNREIRGQLRWIRGEFSEKS